MPTKAPKALLSKLYFKKLAAHPENVNPDELARVLSRPHFQSSTALKSNLWKLFQDLAGASTLKRAGKVIEQSRSRAELQDVLAAVCADHWLECAPAIALRVEAETHRMTRRALGRDVQQMLALLCDAAVVTKAKLSAVALNKLLTSGSALVRCAAARYALALNRAEALPALVPLTFENTPAAALGEAACVRFGDADTVALLWTRALAARKRVHNVQFFRYLHILAALRAVDIMVALRCWIEEDFAASEEAGWRFAESWCALALARFESAECTRDEALADLKWLLHIAERSALPAVRLEDEGVFHLAAAFLKLGETHEAERLTLRVSARSLPRPEHFPQLLPLVLKNSPGPKPTAWLAAAGDRPSQEKIVENWVPHLRAGRAPIDWAMRDALAPDVLKETLTLALNAEQPLAVRKVLKVICGTSAAAVVREELERLAEHSPREVVRWKARRVLTELTPAAATLSIERPKTIRLDAAVLAGAARIVRKPEAPKPNAPRTGLKPPACAGRGWTLDFENLKTPARRETQKALLKAPFEQRLDRRAPLGPSYEERPDVRWVREPASPHNSIDEQMVEMAVAVMQNWIYSEEALTLDINGAAQLASFLSTPGVTMDDEDLGACGAFFGEALRKRHGGEWQGFDGDYTLIVRGQSFDPLGLAKEVFTQKDPMKACMQAAELFERVRQSVAPPEKPGQKTGSPRDTAGAFGRALNTLVELPVGTAMGELMKEVRVFTYRMDATDWPSVLNSCDFLLENTAGARIVAALSVYAPGAVFGRAWAHWGGKLRESSGFNAALVEAMRAAAARDDLEALPDWTFQPPVPRMSFLNSLRKRMNAADWRAVLMLLLRQRANAGDVAGVGWCLFSYKYEFPDALPLLKAFCDLTVSARQTVVRATRHCTRDELSLFRPVWAEALRDPATAVVAAALDAVGANRARSLRFLVEGLRQDAREGLGQLAQAVLESF